MKIELTEAEKAGLVRSAMCWRTWINPAPLDGEYEDRQRRSRHAREKLERLPATSENWKNDDARLTKEPYVSLLAEVEQFKRYCKDRDTAYWQARYQLAVDLYSIEIADYLYGAIIDPTDRRSDPSSSTT